MRDLSTFRTILAGGILWFLSSPSVMALDCSSLSRGFAGRVKDLVTPIAVIGDPDRKELAEYAKDHKRPLQDVEDDFAATGRLDCGDLSATANIVYKGNVLVTSAHVFKDAKDCSVKVQSPESCKFTTTFRGKVFVSGIKNMAGSGFTGYKCPPVPKPLDDWAVLRLDTAIPEGLLPYEIRDKPDIKDNDKITQVSALAGDVYHFDELTGQYTYPKLASDCTSKHTYFSKADPTVAIYFQSDCDSAHMQSGSAILKADTRILQGILKSGDETKEQYAKAIAGHVPKPTTGPWVDSKWSSYNVTVTGDFLSKIKEAGDSDSL